MSTAESARAFTELVMSQGLLKEGALANPGFVNGNADGIFAPPPTASMGAPTTMSAQTRAIPAPAPKRKSQNQMPMQIAGGGSLAAGPKARVAPINPGSSFDKAPSLPRNAGNDNMKVKSAHMRNIPVGVEKTALVPLVLGGIAAAGQMANNFRGTNSNQSIGRRIGQTIFGKPAADNWAKGNYVRAGLNVINPFGNSAIGSGAALSGGLRVAGGAIRGAHAARGLGAASIARSAGAGSRAGAWRSIPGYGRQRAAGVVASNQKRIGAQRDLTRYSDELQGLSRKRLDAGSLGYEDARRAKELGRRINIAGPRPGADAARHVDAGLTQHGWRSWGTGQVKRRVNDADQLYNASPRIGPVKAVKRPKKAPADWVAPQRQYGALNRADIVAGRTHAAGIQPRNYEHATAVARQPRLDNAAANWQERAGRGTLSRKPRPADQVVDKNQAVDIGVINNQQMQYANGKVRTLNADGSIKHELPLQQAITMFPAVVSALKGVMPQSTGQKVWSGVKNWGLPAAMFGPELYRTARGALGGGARAAQGAAQGAANFARQPYNRWQQSTM